MQNDRDFVDVVLQYNESLKLMWKNLEAGLILSRHGRCTYLDGLRTTTKKVSIRADIRAASAWIQADSVNLTPTRSEHKFKHRITSWTIRVPVCYRITTAAVQTRGREALRIIQQPDCDTEKHTHLTTWWLFSQDVPSQWSTIAQSALLLDCGIAYREMGFWFWICLLPEAARPSWHRPASNPVSTEIITTEKTTRS
jgi:hypothetical protein